MEPLDDVEVRVLGALIEKEMATPEYYPLSLNALVNACNQKSNRDPVVSYDAATVEDALERLRANGLATRITGHELRVAKHGHKLSETFNLGRRESAVLGVLLLRGPQTAGELRGRTERLHAFDDVAAVEATLKRLMEFEPALVTVLPRQPGTKEPRYAHLLSGQPAAPAAEAAPPRADRVAELEAAIQALQQQVEQLRAEYQEFRARFD